MSDSLILYRSFHEALKDLSREQYGNVMFAINEYALNQVEIELSGVEKLAFTLIKPQLDANIRRQETGSKGGRPKAQTEKPMVFENEENKKPMVSEKQETEKPMVSKNEENKKPNDNDNTNEDDNDNLNSFDAPAPTAPKKQPKPPLLDREPVNDIERVEKVYLQNYEELHKKGIVTTPTPVINWGQSRKLTKDAISKYGFDVVYKAVQDSLEKNFCVQTGYTLTTILSSGCLAQLINGNDWKHNQRAIDSVDEVSQVELEDMPF